MSIVHMLYVCSCLNSSSNNFELYRLFTYFLGNLVFLNYSNWLISWTSICATICKMCNDPKCNVCCLADADIYDVNSNVAAWFEHEFAYCACFEASKTHIR